MNPNKKRNVSFHDVLMYILLMRKHLRLMTLLMCISGLAGLVYFMYARPVFYAKSLVQVTSLAKSIDDEKLFGDGQIMDVIREMRAPHIRERVAKKLGYTEGAKEFQLKHLPKDLIRMNSQKNMEIEVWPTNVKLAEQWGKTLIEEYNAYRTEKREKEIEMLITSYKTDIERLEGKVKESFAERVEFDREQAVQGAMMTLQELRDVPVRIVQTRRILDELGRVRSKIEDPNLGVIEKLAMIASIEKLRDSSMTLIGALPETQSGGGESDQKVERKTEVTGPVIVVPSEVNPVRPWEGLEKKLVELRDQKQKLSEIYKEGHSKMVALDTQINEVMRQLDVELTVQKSRLNVEYERLLSKKQDLEKKLPQFNEATIRHMDLSATRAREIGNTLPWNQMAANFARKIEALLFGGETARTELTYGSLVELRDTPISPNKMKVALFSILIGLVLAVGVPFLLEYLDHTISNMDQVENQFSLRGLGIVPKIDGEGDSPLLEDKNKKETTLVENFRVIRTNLLSMGALTKTPHVVMVTSSMPKEGKTVVSSNLAASFASMGERTLLMDTDLRRGRLHRLFGYRKNPGVSNVLMDECTLEQACRPTAVPNLDILSAGKHLDTGAELLGSPRFEEVMKELRSKYDRIVVDTPPVLGLSETSILQRFVDGVLFVVWCGNTPLRNMKSAVEMLQSNGANFYGFVLNRLDLSATQNYYQYYYYSYDYYYHYRPKALEQA